MNKRDLIVELSQRSDLTQSEVREVLELLFAVITEGLGKKEKVIISGFGSFQVKPRAARIGVNPKNKEKITIPATQVPTFKPGKKLKEVVCEGNELSS
ncbi:MAG: HU family DNA-binding protein [Evtepia sp.]|uniref:HU family DNA-binding protein n=1 Tax=Evtepia sp. TaxID=2773933 RepID=UPI002A7520F2|nr:HU family DNA-binding protein [Evtepia sp.]MDY3014712.1 HU family DNA-binding protein [Evtepia sp.]